MRIQMPAWGLVEARVCVWSGCMCGVGGGSLRTVPFSMHFDSKMDSFPQIYGPVIFHLEKKIFMTNAIKIMQFTETFLIIL